MKGGANVIDLKIILCYCRNRMMGETHNRIWSNPNRIEMDQT